MSGVRTAPNNVEDGAEKEILQGVDPLLIGILRLLHAEPTGGWVSLPRLVKHLHASGSEVLRGLQVLSDARFGPQQGLGWVHVRQTGVRWQARLTALGQAQCLAMLGPPAQDDGESRSE